jgi:nucleotide-binding universal stress UspA family protein
LADARRGGGRVVVVLALALLLVPGKALADGDPASDVLLTKQVFVPFDTRTSAGAQKALEMAVTEARRAGYPVRVALIERPSDLGAVTALWGKPHEYARFLAAELTFVYKGPLVIVMPSGVGFAHYKVSSGSDSEAVSTLPVQPGDDGPALTAIAAVEKLARRAGHPIAPPALPPPTASSPSGWSRRLAGGGIALAIVVVAGGGFLLVRSRRTRPEP